MRPISTFSIRLLLVCFIIPLSSIKGTAQGFVWGQTFANFGSGNSGVSVCTTDANNNGYFVGSFSGATNFGGQALTAVSDFDMFILKKDAAGNFLWVKQIAGITNNSTMCSGKGIGTDNLGNVYIGGFFQDSFDFDPGPGVHQLSSHGGSHSFVLKLDPAGNFIWVKDMGNHTTVGAITLTCMKLDASANIYFGCSTGGTVIPATVDVDPGPGVYDILCPGPGSNDILIEKLDSAGNFLWVKQISGNNYKGPYGLALDTLSNVYITGNFRGTADFDPGIGVVNLSATNYSDVFIAKYDSAGNYQWAGSLPGGSNDYAYGIATDTFGNVAVTGYWGGSIVDLDPGPGVYNVTSTYSHNGFVLKLRSNGSFAWASTDYFTGGGTAVTMDAEGSVYAATAYHVLKMDSVGNVVWVVSFENDDYATVETTSLSTDNTNQIYVVGIYHNSFNAIDFDSGPGVCNPIGGSGGFIVKLCANSLDIAITANNDTICPQGEIVEITTPAISGANYTWMCNGVVVGSNSNTITTSMPGVYSVFTDLGCPNASVVALIYDCNGYLYDQAGAGENIKATGVEVYPNPTDDKLTIQTSFDNYTVSVLNTMGQIVDRTVGSKNVVMDVSQYSSGVYYLRVKSSEGEVVTRKFVVQQ